MTDVVYIAQRSWSDKFNDHIDNVLSRTFKTLDVRNATDYQDKSEATDRIVCGKRIACRIRRNKYLRDYSNDFTLRAYVNSKETETEIQKVSKGYGDAIYYGFMNEGQTNIIDWFVGDLNVFRAELYYLMVNGKFQVIQNTQNNTKLIAFNRTHFSPKFILNNSRL